MMKETEHKKSRKIIPESCKQMVSKTYTKPTTPHFPVCLIFFFLSVLLIKSLFLWSENSSPSDKHSTNSDFSKSNQTPPKWHQIVAEEFKNKGLKIGLVNTERTNVELPHGVFAKEVKFKRVGKYVKWKDLYPEAVDEDHPELQKCPNIPMPRFSNYEDLNTVVASVPCPGEATNEGYDDVFRLQVNLVVAKVLARSHRTNDGVIAVFLGSCGPMFEIFRCEDLLWSDNSTWIYKPDLTKLKERIEMPVGGCQLAWPSAQADRRQREAYVTVLHSSESYVCGAIVLAQSLLRSKTTRDLILLADSSISDRSLTALKTAGWKIRIITRIRSPNPKVGAYNEYNYSKLRIWQLTQYDKVIFIDADLLVLRNLDEIFSYPQVSSALNSRHIFNSGVMLIEPSSCTFDTLMAKRTTTVSYNGGDQGFLNEIFRWWHRLPTNVNFLKDFSKGGYGPDNQYPESARALHFLGVKPWVCYRDYDCNWDGYHHQRFASDSAHAVWWEVFDSMPKELKPFCDLTPRMEEFVALNRELAKDFNLSRGYWKINISDPRRRRPHV